MADTDPHRVSELVRLLGSGDPGVASELWSLVYDELRILAREAFAGRQNGHTLQPTALVHEIWLKLAGHTSGWEGRSHFFSVAARAMRQVLSDSARARRTDRRGKGWRRVSFHEPAGSHREFDVVDLDDALERLAAAHERHARVVELHWFIGLTFEEIGSVLGITARTAQSDWRASRAFLSHLLDAEAPR